MGLSKRQLHRADRQLMALHHEYPVCYQIRVDVVDVFGYYQGTEYYQHTTTP